MRFHIVSLFPESYPGHLSASVLGKGLDKGIFSLCVHDLRKFGEGPHLMVDDAPYGGGPGMLIKPGPMKEAISDVKREIPKAKSNVPIILLDPRGNTFNQAMADEFAVESDLVILSGNYEGVDERVRDMVTHQVSLGDFVITGGDLAAMIMIDAITRRIPGVLGGEGSGAADSFANDLLQYPQYTRPSVFDNSAVPNILLSGDHKKIAEWRRKQSLLLTRNNRSDLLESADLSKEEITWLREIDVKERD